MPEMTTSSELSSTRNSCILGLLVLSAFINYIDRGSISIAAPMLKEDIGISTAQLGILLSSFFWTYAFFQPVSGWLVDRFNVNAVMAVGFLFWSGATAATGIVHTFAALLAMRLVLGAGESVAYPSYSKIFVRHFPEHRRGFANALISTAIYCGPAFGVFFGGLLIARFGWRYFCIGLGLAGLLWLLPWFRWMPEDETATVEKKSPAGPGWLEILQQRSAWGTCGGLFCLNYISYFMITWLPYYLVKERHFSLDRMAEIGGATYLMSALFSAVAGWITDRAVIAGGSPTVVRKACMALGMAGTGVFLVCCVMANVRLSIILLFTAAAFFGLCLSNVWAITQTLSGPAAAGKWTGLQNFIGNMAGIIAPALTGFVVERTGHFFWAFTIVGGMAALGSLVWIFGLGPVKPVIWKGPNPMVQDGY